MDESQDFQFILPLKNGDLLNSRGDQYYVQQIYASNEIPEQLLGKYTINAGVQLRASISNKWLIFFYLLIACKSKVQQRDPFYIFEHFDTYYSIIENTAKDTNSIRNVMRAFDLLYVTVDRMGQELTPLLNSTEPPSTPDRVRYLNLTKMTLYLLVNVVKRIDIIVQQVLHEQQLNQQKKRAKQVEVLEQYPDWDVKRGKFLVQLYNVMQNPLEKLWSPPVAEESFVS